MGGFLKILIIFAILILALVGIFVFANFFKNQNQRPITKNLDLPQKINMKLTSPAFENNQLIPLKYTCKGQDVNPPLKIEEVPPHAKSLVLVVDDPDAPRDVWSHWIVVNINPSVSFIEENSVPKGGVEGLNDFKKRSYGGPCPPSGIHHYHFKVYALDTILDTNFCLEKKEVEKAMRGHILDWAELVGIFGVFKNRN